MRMRWDLHECYLSGSVGGQIVIVIRRQGRPRASCGMGKTASSPHFDTLRLPPSCGSTMTMLKVNDDDAKRTEDKTRSTPAVFDNLIHKLCSLFCTQGCSCEHGRSILEELAPSNF